MMKLNIAVLFGGKSVEHEVSVISGIQAIMNIDDKKYNIIPVYMTKNNEMYVGTEVDNIESYKNIEKLINKSIRVTFVNDKDDIKLIQYSTKKFGKKFTQSVDIVFPVVHGTNVEDGTLQGYLKTIGVPFVGCDVLSSAVGMDKYITKLILKEHGIPVLDAKIYTMSDYTQINNIVSDVEENILYPVIIKPVNLGSSVGISIAKNKVELINSIDDAFLYSSKILIEKAICNLKEINCSVLGDEIEAIASECEEPMHTDEILSYKDKYVNNAKGSGSKGMASVSRKIPADISAETREEIRELAVKAFKALGCNGVSRIDFMIDKDSDKLYFNEINTIPGSLSFYLWEPIGIPYTELLDRMIKLAIKRKQAENNLLYTFDTNILDTASFNGSKGAKR